MLRYFKTVELYNHRLVALSVAMTAWILYLAQLSSLPNWYAEDVLMIGLAIAGLLVFVINTWAIHRRENQHGNAPKLIPEDES